jgi:ribose transport system ATP-binding protein
MNNRILIMDEPTATLSKYEIEHLFRAIQGLKSRGVSIIYISHRLNEVGLIGDRVTVLKDGRKIATAEISSVSTEEIIRMMLGRDVRDIYPAGARSSQEAILTVNALTAEKGFHDVSFQVHAGEILGITGLVGSGKTELAHALFGILKKVSGEVLIAGKKVEIRSPLRAKSAGLGLLPEDRKRNGVIAALNVRENIALPNLEQFMRYGFISPKREAKTVREYMRVVDIRPDDPQKKVRFLSGGNQQKVVLSKWLCSRSKVFIFDEPTRGIDVGSKIEIYKLMNYLAQSGCGIIMISSEIPEVIGMSDRILVMSKGEVIRSFEREEATSEMILQASIGAKLINQGTS